MSSLETPKISDFSNLFLYNRFAPRIKNSQTRKAGGSIDRRLSGEEIQFSRLTDYFTSPDSVVLTWTATGDDRYTGPAAYYDIRYSSRFLSSSNWDSAWQVKGEPVPRPAGETETFLITGLSFPSETYFALKTCDESGNCSSISNVESTVVPSGIVVTFPDPALDAVIRHRIQTFGGRIYSSELLKIGALYADRRGIVELSGIEYCTNLSSLFLPVNQIVDINPLGGLTNLETLDLHNNLIVDLTPVQNLDNLYSLSIWTNGISDINPLEGLINLRELYIEYNEFSDISALAGLTMIESLFLSGNQIADLGPLVANPGLGQGDKLVLRSNPLSEQSIIEYIPILQARGVVVYY